MLEGKALVVAIMMLTAAPLVVTDDGRAIVGDVTNEVADIFTEDEKIAEDPKLDEVLDDARDEKNSKEFNDKGEDLQSKDKVEEEKECFYLEDIKGDWDKEGKDWDKEGKDWDKEDKWETEEDFFAALEKLSAEQMTMIEDYISPGPWAKRFQDSPDDVKFVMDVTKAAGL